MKREKKLLDQKFRFRKGKSTMDVINIIVEAARSIQYKWFTLIAVDVKNTFNSIT